MGLEIHFPKVLMMMRRRIERQGTVAERDYVLLKLFLMSIRGNAFYKALDVFSCCFPGYYLGIPKGLLFSKPARRNRSLDLFIPRLVLL